MSAIQHKSDRPEKRKLAEIVAEQIEDEIIKRGWPVGTVLGSESELLARYGVSRAVFREAIRIVDHHGVASMRRGPGGGLVVSEPDIEAVVRAMTLLLEYEDIDPIDVNEARMALELSNVRQAAERLTPEGEEILRRSLQEEVERIKVAHDEPPTDQPPALDFHLLLAELSGNPAMRLFIQIISTTQTRQSPRANSIEEFASEVHRTHSRIAEAVLARDPDTAERRMRRHLESVLDFIKPKRRRR